MKAIGRSTRAFVRDLRFMVGLVSLLSCLSLLFIASEARAGTKSGEFAVEEAGRARCSAFVKARSEKSEAYGRYIGFIEGYLTAANRYEPATFDLSPWHNSEAFALILDQHCRKHPQDTMVMSAQRLVAAFQPIRLADRSKLLEVGDPQHSTIIYETILKRAQAALAHRGLYKGQVDGLYDAEVKAALEEFQRSAQLDPSGIPDPATLWVLLNP